MNYYFNKYYNNLNNIYLFESGLRPYIDKAFRKFKEENIHEPNMKRVRVDQGVGLMYRGVITSKSNWARAMDGKISPNTLDDVLRRHDNSIEKLIEYSENNKMNHDYKALFDYAIDSGRIYEITQENTSKQTVKFRKFNGLSIPSIIIDNLCGLTPGASSVLLCRYSLENLMKGRFKDGFINALKNPDVLYQYSNRIFYNNKPLNSSDFNPEKFLQAYENWISTGIWELDSNPSSSTSTSTIGDIIINIAGSIFTEILNNGKFLCDRNKTITMNERFSGKNIIIASNGKQYLVK